MMDDDSMMRDDADLMMDDQWLLWMVVANVIKGWWTVVEATVE